MSLLHFFLIAKERRLSGATWGFPPAKCCGGEAHRVQYRAAATLATNVVFQIDTGAGIETSSVNQQINGFQWVSLGTFAFEAYRKENISERHRHRYEFNNELKDRLMESGMTVSGTSPAGDLVEIIELPDHPWFLGCQFHPEFKSRPMNPHPLFREFIRASLEFKTAKN